MKTVFHTVVLALVVALCLAGVRVASAQVNDRPLTEKWAPTEWGPDDKAGSINRINPTVVMKALRHADRGAGKNALVYHDEFVQTEIGQIGTQFDGPGHIGVRTSKGDFYYNGRWREESYERGPGGRVLGMGVLGVEHVAEKAYVCRGVLLDAAAYRGVKRLPIPKDTKSPGIVTAADVKAMVYRQGLAEIGEGDCVFLYTGHGDLWLNAEWKTLSAEEKAKRRAEFKSP